MPLKGLKIYGSLASVLYTEHNLRLQAQEGGRGDSHMKGRGCSSSRLGL